MLAGTVFWIHSVLSLWLFGGSLIGLFYPRYAPLHALFVGAVIACEWACNWRCPLTDLEKAMLARSAPEQVYDGAFIRHYVRRYFGWEIPPKRIAQTLVIIFTGSVILWGVNLLVGR